MKVIKATEVFTPNTSSPPLSMVKRSEIELEIDDYLDEGGKFVCLQGVTKLGKTTIAETAAAKIDHIFSFDCQNLTKGAPALWSGLASELKQPVQKAMNDSKADTSKWSFWASLGFVSSTAGGEHAVSSGNSTTIEYDLPKAVKSAFEALAELGESIVVVLDDFHFIMDEKDRVEILKALKSVANKSVSVLLVTLPERDNSRIFTEANLPGRNATVEIPLWSEDELIEIAYTGFKELNLWAEKKTISELALNSFGSPQIMHTLSLALCRNVNSIRENQPALTKLNAPSDLERFYGARVDTNAEKWLKQLAFGKGTRGKERSLYPSSEEGSAQVFDGYTVCLQALRNLGPKPVTKYVDLGNEIGKILGLNAQQVSKMQLKGTLKNMNELANAEMSVALNRLVQNLEDPEAGNVPQPFFEWGQSETDQPIKILDPVFLYALKWHWSAVLKSVDVKRQDASKDEDTGVDGE